MVRSRRSRRDAGAHNASIVDTDTKLRFNLIVRVILYAHPVGWLFDVRPLVRGSALGIALLSAFVEPSAREPLRKRLRSPR